MPKPYTVSRRITINAAPETIHPLIDDFRAWRAWSPWEGLDPAMQRDYTGAERGVGAHYAWEGNKEAGKGTMTIPASRTERVDIDLHFDKPFPADNTIVFSLTPAGEATEVEWRMNGTLNLFMQVFSIVKSMDSMVGPDFEKGLRQLKGVAER